MNDFKYDNLAAAVLTFIPIYFPSRDNLQSVIQSSFTSKTSKERKRELVIIEQE
ncbi:hypothetical protein DPMN_162692 [Dreissena polymorpha]|uniref:Uncharacterized protein n=1 Tax=Dreissena polymorpha TaxID=45954 RepID=A0A9D4EVK7_DREPO|nr:hypothetical protein DPMN_162692 [Dreissena polymorpha]